LLITGVTTTGDFSQSNNCHTPSCPLSLGEHLVFRVYFTPTINGLRAGTLAINDNAAGSPQTVRLSGNAVTVFPNRLSFGSVPVNTTSLMTVVVTNNLSVPITLSASLGGSTNFYLPTFPHSSCGTLAAASSCSYVVGFKPTAKKSYSGRLRITDSPDPNSPYAVVLSGKGK
jgi:hypothetical protein